MTRINEKDMHFDTLMDIARKMVLAARTAPKAKGFDNMEMTIVAGNSLSLLANTMKEIGEKEDYDIFLRDAQNVMTGAEVVVLIGTRIKSLGIKYCGLCGFDNCEQKNRNPEVPCTFNTTDLGIAVGSAVSLAMDNRVDNRIMYTIGMAALKLEIFSKEVKIIFGIPLSANSKNPFFDRK